MAGRCEFHDMRQRSGSFRLVLVLVHEQFLPLVLVEVQHGQSYILRVLLAPQGAIATTFG